MNDEGLIFPDTWPAPQHSRMWSAVMRELKRIDADRAARRWFAANRHVWWNRREFHVSAYSDRDAATAIIAASRVPSHTIQV